MTKHDLIIIGAGPAGYVAAIRAAQLGLNVACIEKEAALGGTCLRVGCIPSKALLEASEKYVEAGKHFAGFGIKVENVKLDLPEMLKHKDKIVESLTKGVDALFKKNKVNRYHGHARLTKPNQITVKNSDEEHVLQADNIIIATGSRSANLPGIEPDGKHVTTSTEALSYNDVPKHLVVIGAGYIGLELGSVWRRLGANVTVLEYLDRILPGMDLEIAQEAQKLFKRQGLKFKLQSKVTAIDVENGQCTINCDDQEPITADRVLLAVGRKPNTADLGLEDVGVKLDKKGRIQVDDHYRTTTSGVYAVGDVIPGPMLAHKASEEAVACVEQIVAGYGHVNYHAIPGVVYTEPEIASVGKSEEQLKHENTDYNKGIFHFRGIGRARALGQIDGKVKILAHAKTDRLLGVHIIGPRAGDLIAEVVAAIEFGASSEDLARTSHAHPTLAEAIKEAALAVQNRPIHA